MRDGRARLTPSETASQVDSSHSRAVTHLTDHPLSSGRPRGQLGVGGRWRVQNAAVQDAAEDVEALVTAVEPVAELIEVGLQVRGADAVEDVELPALEVGDHDVHPRKQARRRTAAWTARAART